VQGNIRLSEQNSGAKAHCGPVEGRWGAGLGSSPAFQAASDIITMCMRNMSFCKHLANDLAAISPPLRLSSTQDLLMPFRFISTLVLATVTHPKLSLKAPGPSCAVLA
jgi:hypothetical protein